MSRDITNNTVYPNQWQGLNGMPLQEVNMKNTYNYNNNKTYKNYTLPLQKNLGESGTMKKAYITDEQYVDMYKKNLRESLMLCSKEDPRPNNLIISKYANYQPI